MKVYSDVFTGEQLLSDAFPIEVEYEDAVMFVRSAYISKGGEDVDIGCGNEFGGGDEEEKVEDTAERVLNVVDNFQLQQTSFDKKQYGALLRAYMQKLKTWLEENAPDRVAPFQTGAAAFAKFLMANFKEFEFYTGPSYDVDAMVVLSYWKDESDPAPTFVFFKDGLHEQKY